LYAICIVGKRRLPFINSDVITLGSEPEIVVICEKKKKTIRSKVMVVFSIKKIDLMKGKNHQTCLKGHLGMTNHCL
jgi:hypothetical protein